MVLKLILLPNNNTLEAADEIFRVTQPYAAYAGFSHGKMFELINCKLHPPRCEINSGNREELNSLAST